MTEVLNGASIRLRRPGPDDVAVFVAVYGDARVMTGDGGALEADAAERKARRRIDEVGEHWIMILRPEGEAIGVLETHRHDAPRLLIHPDWWGQDLGTEVLWLARLGRPDQIQNRIRIPIESTAGRRIAERCGYRVIEHSDGEMSLQAREDVDQRLAALERFFVQRTEQRTRRLQQELGIPEDYGRHRRLQPVAEPRRLVAAGCDCFDRPLYLTEDAGAAFVALTAAAAADGVTLEAVSGFRDVDYQAGLIRRKLEAGQALDQILSVSAAPGFSEHHGGHALDLNTPGCQPLEADFEATPAYAWLQENARRFGFVESFPRDNPHGLVHEPWHWAFRAD